MIKSKFVKKVLTAALALSLVMAPVVGVSAETVSGNRPSVSENTGAPAAESGENEGASDEGGNREEEVVEIPSTSMVRTGGEYRTTTLRGAYMSETFEGTVVGTDKDTLAAAYGVASSAQPYIRIYDISETNTPAAMTSIEATADAVGGTVIGAVNMEIGSLENGEFTLLSQNGREITMIFSIPRNQVREGYAYAMISVRPGGTIEILPDLDGDSATVTFQTTAGLGAYAMIAYPAA